MNALEILKQLNTTAGFIGVYPINAIPSSSTGSMIINSQTSNLPGQHWMCLVVNKTNIVFFDPLNMGLPILLYNHIVKKYYGKKLFKINYSSQSINSNLCAHHCIFFIKNGYPAFNDNKFLL